MTHTLGGAKARIRERERGSLSFGGHFAMNLAHSASRIPNHMCDVHMHMHQANAQGQRYAWPTPSNVLLAHFGPSLCMCNGANKHNEATATTTAAHYPWGCCSSSSSSCSCLSPLLLLLLVLLEHCRAMRITRAHSKSATYHNGSTLLCRQIEIICI